MPIPLVDVRAQLAPLRDELLARLGDVVDSGRFILGPNVAALEREAADVLGARHAVGVANGTDAIVLVLDALGIGPGDEVVCPAFTFYATAEAIARTGARPVFADVDPATLNLDPEDVAERVTPRTRAIVAVHLFGRPAPLHAMPEGIPVIEDAAQAFGATLDGQHVGSIGAAGTFSFFPTKNLFCLGDGGLVATNDDGIADRVDQLRKRGSRDGKKTFELVEGRRGWNSRLDELQAAVVRLLLPRLEEWNAARRDAAARYAELGLGELCELPEDDPGHVYHMYVVRVPDRDRVALALGEAGIGTASHYARPLHVQPALEDLGYLEGDLPETERASTENLSLPMWAGITPEQQEAVVAGVRRAVTVVSTS